jgi:hypothetical protein
LIKADDKGVLASISPETDKKSGLLWIIFEICLENTTSVGYYSIIVGKKGSRIYSHMHERASRNGFRLSPIRYLEHSF